MTASQNLGGKGQPARERRAFLKIGSVCAIVGTGAYAVSSALHGSLTGSEGAEVFFRHVLQRPYWDLIHLGYMLAIVCWLGTFITVARSLGTSENDPSSSSLFGRFAVASLTVGAALTCLHFSIDGYVLTELADDWANASPQEREAIVQMGDFVHALLRTPLFVMEPILLFGLPCALIGLGIAIDRTYPTWLGWAGFAVGLTIFVTGATWFVDLRIVPDLMLFAVLLPLEWSWLLALGVVMWRQSNAISDAAVD